MDKIIIAFMNSYSEGKSGGDVAFIDIFKRIDGCKKTIVTSSLGRKLCENSGLNADYYLTTQEKSFKNVILTYIKRVFKGCLLIYKIKDYDVIYSSSDFLPDVLPSLFFNLKSKKSRWVQKIYHLIPEERRISYLAQKLSFYLIRKYSDLVIITDPSLRGKLGKRGFDLSKVVLNPIGIDIDYFKRIKPIEKYAGVFIARLHPSKGIFDLVDIWEKIIEKFKDAKLAVIGHGNPDVVEELKRRIREKGLENNIDLLGFLEDDRAYGLLKGSKIFILPSYEEGYGIVIIEAMACGIPAVTYDLPVFREFFKDKIDMVRKGEKEEIAKCVEELLVDEGKRQEKHIEIMKYADRFNVNHLAREEKRLMDL